MKVRNCTTLKVGNCTMFWGKSNPWGGTENNSLAVVQFLTLHKAKKSYKKNSPPYIYIYIYVCVCICICICVLWCYYLGQVGHFKGSLSGPSFFTLFVKKHYNIGLSANCLQLVARKNVRGHYRGQVGHFYVATLNKLGHSQSCRLKTDSGMKVTSLVYPRCSQPCCATALLRHSNDDQIRLLRRNRVQGDLILIDFLQSEVMQKNCPTLVPSTLWAPVHCMKKRRFTFGTVIGVDCFHGDPQLTVGFQEYLTQKEIHPRQVEFVTIASCAGHSFVITNEIPQGESEDIEILTETSYAKYGSICHGTHIDHDQSIVRNGLDVDFGTRAGLSARNMIHFCVATNPSRLKHHGLYCYVVVSIWAGVHVPSITTRPHFS